MKHIKTYENRISLINLVAQIKTQNYKFVDDVLSKGVDVNSTIGSSISYPLIMVVKDIGMLELLTKHGADWYKLNHNGMDFIDNLETRHKNEVLLKYVKWKYPDRYKEHIIRKNARDYNL